MNRFEPNFDMWFSSSTRTLLVGWGDDEAVDERVLVILLGTRRENELPSLPRSTPTATERPRRHDHDGSESRPVVDQRPSIVVRTSRHRGHTRRPRLEVGLRSPGLRYAPTPGPAAASPRSSSTCRPCRARFAPSPDERGSIGFSSPSVSVDGRVRDRNERWPACSGNTNPTGCSDVVHNEGHPDPRAPSDERCS